MIVKTYADAITKRDAILESHPWQHSNHVCLAQAADSTVEIIALILLPLAIAMSAYALLVFLVRGRAIQKKSVSTLTLRLVLLS